MSRAPQPLHLDAVTTAGALLPLDFLGRLMGQPDAALAGLTPEAYGLVGQSLEEGAADAWHRLRAQWQRFQADLAKAPAATQAQVVRQRWLDPLFVVLGYQHARQALTAPLTAPDTDRTWAISHRAWHTPIHTVGWKLPLDTRTKGARGAAAQAPHALLQGYLNRAEHDRWGLVTNGAELRILRQHRNLSQQPYLGFDLQAIFDGSLFPEFRLLWLTAHASRLVPRNSEGAAEDTGAEGPFTPAHSYLEQWRAVAEQAGVKALDDLRAGVEQAIQALGDGFHRDPTIKQRLAAGALDKQAFFRPPKRPVYRR
ncbi:MAG: hypothetical protein KC613_27795, partial [Myxococcales bacterium]|nr:hypothetical protein [Myxococcales bacterium]